MSRLISDAYQKLNYELHQADPDYGATAAQLAPLVAKIVAFTSASAVLDYGCGKGTLKPALRSHCPNIAVFEYDPAVPGKDHSPSPADLVVCFDVMEHIEPAMLDAVLDDLRRVTRLNAILTISTVAAKKTLPDGRNAHLIVRPHEWWTARLSRRFRVVEVQPQEHGFLVILRSLKT